MKYAFVNIDANTSTAIQLSRISIYNYEPMTSNFILSGKSGALLPGELTLRKKLMLAEWPSAAKLYAAAVIPCVWRRRECCSGGLQISAPAGTDQPV